MLKGKTVIELTDVRTGQKEVYEDTNMVTEALADIFNTNIKGMLYNNTSFNGSSGDSWLLPIKKNVMGGILLYQNEIDERADNLYYTPKTTATKSAAATPFLVKVSITDLNIRKGPGTDYAKTGERCVHHHRNQARQRLDGKSELAVPRPF